eukprot:g18517.t1
MAREGPGSSRLWEVSELARWRGLGVVALSEFAYVRSAIENAAEYRRRVQANQNRSDDVVLEGDQGASRSSGPEWLHLPGYDLVWLNGAGLMIVDPGLRQQIRKMKNAGDGSRLKTAIRWRPRMLAVHFEELIVMAAYSPTRNCTAETIEFDGHLRELFLEMRKRKDQKWKFKVALGDYSAQVGGNEFRGYGRVSMNVQFPRREGVDVARGAAVYDHMAIELVAEIKSLKQLKVETAERKMVGKVVAANLSKEVVKKLSDGLKAEIAAADGAYTLEQFQDYLIKVLPLVMVPRKPVKAPKKLRVNPARLAEDGQSRARMWEIFREVDSNNRGNRSCGITSAQATGQYKSVGSNPLGDDSLPLPIEGVMGSLVEKFPREQLAKLDAPIGYKEFCGAVARTRGGGKAADIHGLTGEMLKFFGDSALRPLHAALNEELQHKTLTEMASSLHRCRDSSLYKGKVARELGLDGARCWRNVESSHRDAVHRFGDDAEFVLPHGTKEGCVSSPLVFILIYTPAIRLWRRRCEQAGLVETGGIRLAANDDDWHRSRRDRLTGLLTGVNADREVRLRDLLFADDTTALTLLSKATAAAMTKESIKAKQEERMPMETPAMVLLSKTLADAGMRENESKREQGGICELAVRNLGAFTSSEADMQNKASKAWRAFHRLKKLMSGVAGISDARKGELIVVM